MSRVLLEHEAIPPRAAGTHANWYCCPEAVTHHRHAKLWCVLLYFQAGVLEKYLSGYDEDAHVPSRMDAASKLAPVCASSDATTEKVCAVSFR